MGAPNPHIAAINALYKGDILDIDGLLTYLTADGGSLDARLAAWDHVHNSAPAPVAGAGAGSTARALSAGAPAVGGVAKFFSSVKHWVDNSAKTFKADFESAFTSIPGVKDIPGFVAKVKGAIEKAAAASPSPYPPSSKDFSTVPIKDIPEANSVADVKAAILKAKADKAVLRLSGSQHSIVTAVFDKDDLPAVRMLRLNGDLRKIVQVSPPGAPVGIFQVGGGCNLGIDPTDPGSSAANSITHTVDAAGYAFPDLGGITHQTLGGFMACGSAGGSLEYSFQDALQSFTFVDGNGEEQTFAVGSDEFAAGVVSFGLFGVIVSVTLSLGPKYMIAGHEQNVAFEKSGIATSQTLVDHFTKPGGWDYSRLVWLPNEGCNSVLQWMGNRSDDFDPAHRVPYVHPYDNTTLKGKLNILVTAIGLGIVNGLEAPHLYKLVGAIIGKLQPLDDPKPFLDYWWRCLPADDLTDTDFITKFQFTEIWVDKDEAVKYGLIEDLHTMFTTSPGSCGNFGCEFYAAKESQAWMSCGYGRDSVRVDPMWIEVNKFTDINQFFGYFWTTLLPKYPSARLHWGKHAPAFGMTFPGRDGAPSRTIGPDYVAKSFPKFGDWLALRERFDPSQVFVTPHWRSFFGIPPPASA